MSTAVYMDICEELSAKLAKAERERDDYKTLYQSEKRKAVEWKFINEAIEIIGYLYGPAHWATVCQGMVDAETGRMFQMADDLLKNVCTECSGTGLSMQPGLPDGEPEGLTCITCSARTSRRTEHG